MQSEDDWAGVKDNQSIPHGTKQTCYNQILHKSSFSLNTVSNENQEVPVFPWLVCATNTDLRIAHKWGRGVTLMQKVRISCKGDCQSVCKHYLQTWAKCIPVTTPNLAASICMMKAWITIPSVSRFWWNMGIQVEALTGAATRSQVKLEKGYAQQAVISETVPVDTWTGPKQMILFHSMLS